MKILFLIQDERMPSSRVRVVNLRPELARAGINAEMRPYPSSLKAKFQLFRACRDFDVVYLQKKLPTLPEFFLLRRAAKKLVFDFDDAIYCRHDARTVEHSHTRRARFDRVIRNADLVVAGNDFLAEQARPLNARVEVVASAVETRNVPVKPQVRDSKPVVIGWVGTAGNFNHLQLVTPVLTRLAVEFGTELRVISNRAPEMDVPGLQFVPWSLETQDQEVARFDIGIMPLPATRFSEGKCGYKALQYMAAAVPPVVSDVGVNRQIVEEGRSGFVVREPDDFYSALSRLIQDRQLRAELGQNARRRVEENYSIEVVGRKLAGILKKLSA